MRRLWTTSRNSIPPPSPRAATVGRSGVPRLIAVPKLQLLPAVDVADGQAVRLVQGEAGSETSYGSPLEAALQGQRAGAGWGHLVGCDAAFGRGSNRELLAEVVGRLDVKVEMSGGIRDDASLEAALATGCARVNLGTAAPAAPDWGRGPRQPRYGATRGARLGAVRDRAVRRQDRGRPRRSGDHAVGTWVDAGRRGAVRGGRPARRRGVRALRRHRRPPRRHPDGAEPLAARRRVRRHHQAG